MTPKKVTIKTNTIALVDTLTPVQKTTGRMLQLWPWVRIDIRCQMITSIPDGQLTKNSTKKTAVDPGQSRYNMKMKNTTTMCFLRGMVE